METGEGGGGRDWSVKFMSNLCIVRERHSRRYPHGDRKIDRLLLGADQWRRYMCNAGACVKAVSGR